MRPEAIGSLIATLVVSIAGCVQQPPVQRTEAVQRMYVFNCGDSTVKDISRWTPGVNVGKSGEFSAHCYLIRHVNGLMLWDSGIHESVVGMPGGFQRNPVSPRYTLLRTLTEQLAEIGLRPTDITHVAFSHTHGDHVGNANLFAGALVYMQEAEYEAAFGPEAAKKYNFETVYYEKLRASKIVTLNGDYDVFGDGSVTIIATPGHTPGHQSLLVRLPRYGPVILSGDMVHLQENWFAKRVPSFNFDREQSLRSMEKVADIMARTGAELWINHDKQQTARFPKSPRYFE